MIILIIYLIVGIIIGLFAVGGFEFDILFFMFGWPWLMLDFLQDLHIEWKKNKK